MIGNIWDLDVRRKREDVLIDDEKKGFVMKK